MIQRIQTVWLLLGVILSALTFKFTFFIGTQVSNADGVVNNVINASYNIPLIITATASILLGLLAIFLFKDRKKQLAITALAALASIALTALCFYFKKDFPVAGVLALTSVFYFAIPIFYILAILGIRKDQKIIANLNSSRLR